MPARVLNIGNHRSEQVSTLVRLLEQSLGRRAVLREAPRPPADVAETFAADRGHCRAYRFCAANVA